MSWAWFKSENKVELGMSETETCDLCGEKEEDTTHIVWECKKIHTEDSCKKIEKVNSVVTPRNLKLGAPNAKHYRMDASEN